MKEKIFKTAVILAGGKSSRMGFDKQFMKVNNEFIINNIICNLKKEFEDIIIVTNKPYKYKDSGCRILSDEITGIGPLSGIQVGLKNSKSEYVYFTACDMPNINLEYIVYMKKKLLKDNSLICVSKKNNRIEPFNGFYSVNLMNKVVNLIKSGKRSMNDLIKNEKTLIINNNILEKYSEKSDMFLNLNTQEDLKRFEKIVMLEEKNV